MLEAVKLDAEDILFELLKNQNWVYLKGKDFKHTDDGIQFRTCDIFSKSKHIIRLHNSETNDLFNIEILNTKYELYCVVSGVDIDSITDVLINVFKESQQAQVA